MGIGGAGAEELSRVFRLYLLQPLRYYIQRLIPAYLYPLRVYPDAFYRICPLERDIYAVRVIKEHHASHTTGADPALAAGAIGIPLDLHHDPIDAVNPYSTRV